MPYVNGRLKAAPSYPKQIDFYEAVNNEPLLHSTTTDSNGNYGLNMGARTKYHAVVDGCYAPPIIDVADGPLTVNLTYGTTVFP